MWKKVCLHILFWIVYKSLGIVYMVLQVPEMKLYFWDLFLFNATIIANTYIIAYFILPKLLPRKHGILKVSLAITTLYFVFAYGARYQLIYTFQPWLNPESPYIYDHFSFHIEASWAFIEPAMFGFGYWFAMNAIKHEKEKRLIEEQHRQLEKQHYEAELAFLKNQLNPHFLYNTLNYFYAETFQLSQELGNNVIKLSDLLRYSLKGNASTKVPLSEEIHYLENFISINNLRFDNELCIQFLVEGQIEKKQILPLILISFVENAFKHGNLRDEEEPLVIKIDSNDNCMRFYIRNKIGNSFKEMSTGIGLINLKRRLELAYGNKHGLTISESVNCYTCDLIIFE